GTADTLSEAASALRRADMHDKVNVTPVYAEIEVEVATTARNLFSAMAASTLRRCPASSEP
ncbi:hypothetical protein C241_14692, partial [Bradyrhizobium lupini HPC(L)]